MKKTSLFKPTGLAAFSSGFVLLLSQSATASLFVRGTHNQWGADEMQCSYRYGLTCDTVVSFGGVAEFKFDAKGDWSQSYGANATHANCAEFGDCFGQLYDNGANIRVEPNKDYLISASFAGNSKTYDIQEIPPFPKSLAEGENVRKQWVVSTTSGYGSRAAQAKILVRNLSYHKRVGISYRFGGDTETRIAYATFDRSLENGQEVWNVHFRGFGSANFEVFVEQLDDSGEHVVATYWDRGPNGEGYSTSHI